MCRTSSTTWWDAGTGSAAVPRREERSRDLCEAVSNGPPPLGPGAPARERLLAFLKGLGAIAEGNAILLAAPADPRRFTRSVQEMATALIGDSP